ncbi:hypothetical protein ABM976_000924 [Escherichia coli]|nr:hypothetical protein [Escherichia coli]HAS1060827.1 hypothetical protein [Enterobacter cloacae]
MSHSVFTVEFEDGFRMYGINDGSASCLHPFLFLTPNDAKDWIFSGNRETRKIPSEPENALFSDAPIVIGPGEAWAFNSRASRTARWITGPLFNQDALESWGDNDIYG